MSEDFYFGWKGTIGYKNHLNSISKELDEFLFLLLEVENEKSQIHRGSRDGFIRVLCFNSCKIGIRVRTSCAY